jgi:hypothetical protein
LIESPTRLPSTLAAETLFRPCKLAYERGYFAPGVARNEHGTVLYLVSHKVKVRQRVAHGYREPGMAKRQVHAVGLTLNGCSCKTRPVQFLANVGGDFELAQLE